MINNIIHKIVFTCKEATLLLELQDNEFKNPIQKLRLKIHLKICKACHAYQKKRLIIDRLLQDQYTNKTVDLKYTIKEDAEHLERLKEKIISNLPNSKD